MNTILEHIALWTTAQTPKTSGRGNRADNQQLLGIQKLRELILELAVRGKLVPQDPSDEPASILLKKIEADKKRLVKEGKIKKQEVLPEVGEDEKPFELPESWEWVRLGETGIGSTGKTPITSKLEYFNGQIPFIGPGQITPDGKILDSDKTLSELGCNYSTLAKAGDILMVCIGGSIGKCGIVKSLVAFNQQLNCIHPLINNSYYLNISLNAPYFQTLILKKATGSATPIINRSKWEEILIPLPPLAEQHRIVAKVDELMALCDQLEQQQTENDQLHQTLVETLLANLTQAASPAEQEEAWQRIANHFDTLFTTDYSIDQLKQTILQLAVMGKLVPQDPADEPANELLKKITKEKARLVKEGKIKKQAPLPEITDDEKPFELPEGWEWTRIGDATLFTEYGMSEMTYEGIKGIPVIKMGDIQNGTVILEGQKMVPSNVEGLPSLFLKNGDLLYNRTNSAELVGKTGIFEGEDNKYTFASYLIRIRCSEEHGFSRFLNLSMNEPSFRKTQIEPHLKQQCGQANVNGTILKSMIVPLPPLAEQHRIVAKVDELFAICDTLKERLAQAQTTQNLLAETVVKQALATKPASKVEYATNEQLDLAAEPGL